MASRPSLISSRPFRFRCRKQNLFSNLHTLQLENKPNNSCNTEWHKHHQRAPCTRRGRACCFYAYQKRQTPDGQLATFYDVLRHREQLGRRRITLCPTNFTSVERMRCHFQLLQYYYIVLMLCCYTTWLGWYHRLQKVNRGILS